MPRIKSLILCVLAIPLVAVFVPGVFADNIKSIGNNWYEVVSTANIHNITFEEATRRALETAYNEAIIYSTGIEIRTRNEKIRSGSDGKIGLNHFFSLSKQNAAGIILDKKIIEKSLDEKSGEVTLKVRVKVGRKIGESDPAFVVKGKLNRKVFHENDELIVTASSKINCFVTILNISGDTVFMLLPNEFRRKNFLAGGGELTLPDKSDYKNGIVFQAMLESGKKEEHGLIKIIATKNNITPYISGKLTKYRTYQTALIELQSWISTIPRDELEEVDIPYVITKK